MLELSAETRRQHLARMADGERDVLVVGGGITGAGVALDAVTRGFSVALVEREDFAAGTSGRSSRLIHGGARYLRHLELGIVRESLRERDLLRRLAPHLVRSLAFFIPVRRFVHHAAVRAGLALYDVLAGRRNIHRRHRVDAEEAARLAPTLSYRTGGYVTYDCRTDDARITLGVLRQAVARGALVANHAEVEGLAGEGRVTGARIRDRMSGETLEARARIVVNATGAWADRLHRMVSDRARPLRPSKGIHLVFDRERVPIRSAVMVPSLAGGDALVFVIPWGPRVWAGTTDTPYEGPVDEPVVAPEDVHTVLGSLAKAFDGDLTEADVVASWAGVRPLLDAGEGSTRDLSRRHVVMEDPPGLVTVTGGKFTTFRAMAEEVVDLLVARLGAGGPCRTREIPLGMTRPLLTELGRAATAAERHGLAADAGRRLVGRYGDDWEDVLGLIQEDSSLGEPVVPGLLVLRAETVVARTREMALTDADVLVRRTRLATMDAGAAAEAAVP